MRQPPRESVLLPILLVLAAIAATCIAIPCAASKPPPGGKGWLPWALLATGLVVLGVAVFERNAKIDLKKRAFKHNAMILLLGPVGSRVAFAVLGGAFLGAGIGLFAV